MKLSKKLTAYSVAGLFSVAAMAPVAHAEGEGAVTASVGIANTYLWRGFELGSGTPALSGDITVSGNGFYGSVWGSSGDTSAGTEYDLIVGYGGEVEGFSYDINVTSYIYPTGDFQNTDGKVGDFAEVIVSLGYGPVSVVYHDNIAGETGGYAFNEDYSYAAISGSFGSFSATLGKHFEDAPIDSTVTGDAMHLDLSYAFNDSLAFTVSAILDADSGFSEPEPTFVISYSMPIEF